MARLRGFDSDDLGAGLFGGHQTPDPTGGVPFQPPTQQEAPAQGPAPVVGPGGNTERPREVSQDPGPRETRPSTQALGAPSGGSSTNAPPMPDSPSPVVAQPPAPFTPLPQSAPTASLVTPTPQAAPQGTPVGMRMVPNQPIQPFVSPVFQNEQDMTTRMFGKAGGLQGGGLGIPGAGNDFEDPSQLLDSLIKTLTGI